MWLELAWNSSEKWWLSSNWGKLGVDTSTDLLHILVHGIGYQDVSPDSITHIHGLHPHLSPCLPVVPPPSTVRPVLTFPGFWSMASVAVMWAQAALPTYRDWNCPVHSPNLRIIPEIYQDNGEMNTLKVKVNSKKRKLTFLRNGPILEPLVSLFWIFWWFLLWVSKPGWVLVQKTFTFVEENVMYTPLDPLLVLRYIATSYFPRCMFQQR